MQDNDTSRRRKFYDQMSEAYDLGTFEEFDTKMNNPESRRKLHEFIDQDGKYDIGDFEYFDNAMKPVEKAAVEQPVVQQDGGTGSAPAAPAPKTDEYPQPYDINGNVLTNNGKPYSQEVLKRYYSPDNKEGNFRDLASIAKDLERDESVSRMQTTGGAGYVPAQSFTIKEAQQQTGKTPEEKIADEQAAQHNDEFWSQDPTLQQRKEYNARNAILLDPTIPRDQRSVFQKENRQNLIDVSNPRYASIIHHKEAVDEGMRVFDEAMKKAEEEGRQSIVNALRNTGGLESLARTMSPNGDIMPDINAIRQGNETADPQKVMDKVVQDVSDSLMKNEYFTKDGKQLNDAGRYAIMDLRQRMVQQLVDARVPKSTAEYVVLTAIKNSDIGKLTRMATNTAYENWLDDVAASEYDAGFWEKVVNGTLTFGLNLPEYLGTGVAGGAVSKKIIGEFTKRTANELMKRGVQKATAERAAQMVINNSLAGTATKLGASSAAGATTFGLQPVIGEPIDITYQAGQPGPIEGSVNAPGLSDYLSKTVKEMGKNTAMGALMIGGAAAKTAEKIAEGAVKEGIARGAAGLAYDSSVMAYFSLQDMKDQIPGFEITPQTAAEAFAESAASLALLKAPHMFGLRGKIKDAKEFNRKFNFTPEDKEVLKSMGIDNPLDMVEKLAYKGASPETIKKGEGDVTLPSADGIQSIDAEEMQQLTSQYRTFMASDAPETLKAKVQYLIEGKMPQQFSAPVDSRVVERDGNVYLETINENGGVIESRKMKDLLSAEKERMQLNFDIDTNKTAAMERRLNEQEVVSDFANNLAQEYEEARVKSISGEELTAEERQAVYLYQNFDMLQAALERQAAGAELLPEQQALINAMTGRTKAYVNRGNASKQVAREIESQFGLQEGELDKIMNGHTKDEAMTIANETGEQVFEIGNGIYPSNSEFNIIEKYREALLNRINENIARKNAEDVSQAAEEAQLQDNTPRIESKPGEIESSDNGGEGNATPPPAGTSGGEDGTITQGSGPITQGYSETSGTSDEAGSIPSDETLARRDAAYNRGASVADDPSQLPSITYDSKLATARMAQQLPDSNPVTARLRKIITDAVLEGNDAQADRIIAEAVKNAQLTPQQVEVIDQWRDAVESQRGVDDSIIQQTENFEDEQRQQLDTIAASDGTVTQLQMKDGSTAYLKSGELANRYGGIMVSDETGKTRQEQVSAVQAVVSINNVDDLLAERVNDFAATLQAQYAGISDGSVLTPGQQVDMVLSGQPVAAVVAGTDAQGNVIFQLEDGSQMPLAPADAQQAIAAADDVKIQAQLEAEKETAVAQQQTQRFTQGIKGYAEGQPDLSAADTDAKTAADYILSQLGADGSDPEKGRKQQLKDIQATKDQMKIRQEEAQSELTRQQQWLDGNEDIADPAEIEQVKQRITMLTDAIADLQQRQQKWGDIRMNLMTREEQNQLEQERRREIFKARNGYEPTTPQRNLTTNEDRVTLEDGQPNFGLTPVGNANNYLLRNYQESTDAEKFVNAQRLALRNKQRDEVQPEINKRNDMLNAYASGSIELTPDEVTQLVHEVADLENYQDTLSNEAVNLRNIAEGIPALYERNNRNQELTPAEQRGKALDKAGSRDDKLRIARNIYKVSPEAIDIINDQTPKTIEEFISDNLPYGKLNWEGFDRGERHFSGVQEAVFGKNGATRGIGKDYSTNAFNTYLAPEGQGMGFDEMVHYLYESSPEVDGRKLYDDTQIRDALINMLLTAKKPTDISHLMIDNRIAEAEDIIRRQEEYDREMEEEAKYQELQEWADAYHLNPDEVESYQDYLNEKPWEFDEEVINQIIADDEQNRQSKEMDRQHPDRPAGSEGEGGENQVQVSGSAEGAAENIPITGQSGSESSTTGKTVPDNNVSGGEQRIDQYFPARLAKAKAETDTNPTEAQKEAGNYKMGHIKFGGYQMSIENPKGSIRSGVDQNKQPWSIEMQDTYGYIGKKYGTDGDHLDFFINDDADLDTFEGRVFVVDQKNEDGTFDEHKVMYGYPTWSAARKAYERNYEDGWWDKHVMQMTGVSKADFDKWLADSDHKTKPFSDYNRTKNADTIIDPIDQLRADIMERQQKGEFLSLEPSWTEKEIGKKDASDLRKLREKAKRDASTARVLLETTNIEKGSEKENRLKHKIAQAEFDIDYLDREIAKRQELFRQQAEDMEAGGAMIDHLQNMGIDVNDDISEIRRTRKKAEKDNSEEGRMRKMATSDGKVYGFAYRGKLYIDPRELDANLPLHEYGHLWCEAFRRLNPEGWKNVVGVMKQDKDTWQFIKQLNPELTNDDDIAEEVISKGSGDNGQQRIMEEFERMSQNDPSYKGKWNNIWKNISKAIQDFWKKVGDFLHIKYESPKQVYDQVLRDFANGVNPRKKVEEYLKQRDADYQQAVKDGDISKATKIFNEALKENIGNGITPYIAVDNYRKLQQLARKVKKGDKVAIERAAEMMSHLIPENAVLIPVPSHGGRATDMLQLAYVIADKTGSDVADILTSNPRQSQFEVKKQGGKAIKSEGLGIKVDGTLPDNRVPVVIDNVVDSGNTAEACIKALGTGIVVSLADSADKNSHAATLKSALPVVEDREGNVIPLSRRFELGSRYLGKKPDTVGQLLDEVKRRQEFADEIKGEQEVQAAIESHEEERLTLAEAVTRERATDAVVQVVGDTGVPIKQVSQEEADQMMELFTTLNQQAIIDYARNMRPNEMKRYAVINVRDPYAVPKYFEKRNYADEYQAWANRTGGLFMTVDLDKWQEQSEELKQAANIQAMSDLWHGSGAVFTKFDHSYMGKGAGSQTFGWGTYLTNSKAIGEDYSNITSGGWTYKGKNNKQLVTEARNKDLPEGRYYTDGEIIAFVLRNLNNGYDFDKAVDMIRKNTQSQIDDHEEHLEELSPAELKDLEGFKEELALINSLKPSDFVKPNKNLYKVKIPDDNGSNYLNWEEEISEKLAQEIRDRIFEFVTTNSEFGWNTTQDHVRLKTELQNAIIGKGEKGEEGYPLSKVYPAMSYYLGNSWAGARNIGAKRASEMLGDIGYVGIKYPAGTIYGNGRGATNYVIFNEDDAKIVEHIQFMFDDGAFDAVPPQPMKESVMQGQPMFQKGQGGRVYGWTDGKGIFLTPLGMNPNSPMHEYTHIWDMYIQKHDPKLWKEMVATFKKTAAWKELRENSNYRSIWEDDNRMASEVHSRLTGARSEEEFENAAANPDNKDAADIISQVKDVLRRFWEKLAQLFKFGGDRLEEFVLMPLRDALKGFNPIMGDYSLDPRAMVDKMVERTLMGVHNISEEKLKKALKVGGLANPSMAVIDTKQHMHTDYGEISLIPKDSLIDARTGRNAGTFTADAWTPSYPQVVKRMTDKGQSKFWKDIRKLNEEAGELASKMRMAFDTWLDKEVGQERLAYWYLSEKGLKPELVLNKNPYGKEVANRLDELTDNGNKMVASLPEDQIKEIADMYHAYKERIGEPVTPAEERIKKLEERIDPNKQSPFTNLQRFRLEELKKYGELLHNLSDFTDRARMAAYEEGKPNADATMRKAQEAVESQNLQADFDKWLDQKAQNYAIEEWLYNGTDNQGRQKWVRNTLDNASKLMKKEGLNGAVGWSSLGSWIATVANKEKTLEGIRRNKKNLSTSEEEHDAWKEQWGEKLYPLVEKLGNGNVFHGDNVLKDILEHKDFASYYKREYGRELTQDDKDLIDTFIKEVRTNFPTGYFETKFERPVMLDEFEIAVVPESTSPEVVEALKNAGLDVRTYDASDYDKKDENRTKAAMDAVNERNDILFQIDQPMAGEKGVKSLMEGNLFSDADFLPQPTKKEKEISELNDEDLLDNISKTDGKERRQYIDEYDKRHDAERKEETNAYYDMLESSNTTKDQALEMYNSVYRQFMKDGYATADRTKLMGQMDALEDYIQSLDEAEAERDMEEAAVTQQQTQPEPTEAEQKYEEQKKEVQKLGYDLTQMKLRPLEEGETCHVERRYMENGMFSFTGKERIESIDDVAYIFKQLEDAAVENTFLVLEKDGVPTIIHLATGLYTASYAKADPALAAYSELQPDKVYFIHNHPSGNLMCSKADEDVLKTMSKIFGNKLQPGIIIDTKSGKYGLFGNTLPISPSTQNKMPEKVEGEVPMKVYSFSKQVFDAEWNPETAFEAGTAARVATFVSSHRLGDHKKTSLIVMTQNWKVTGNVFLPWTTLKEAVTIEGADLIARYMNQMGGTIVTLYGDYDFNDIESKGLLGRLKNMLNARGVYLADVIHVDNDKLNYKSAHEMGMIGEPGPENGRAGEADIIKMQPKFHKLPEQQIEDLYHEGLQPGEAINMQDRVLNMSPKELVEQYERLNSQMLDENGLNVDEQEDAFRRKWADEHGWPPAQGSGFGKASADHFQKQVEKYTYNKMHLRWEILDRINELGLEAYIDPNLKGFMNPKDLDNMDSAKFVRLYRRTTPEIEKANARFNQELDRQINDPTFPKDHIYKLGKPGVVLLSTGFPNDDIEMSASHLLEKSRKTQHPFKLEDVKNLVKAINNPIAVFSYGDENKAQNVIVELERDGKKFMVGIHFKQGHRGSVVSDIRGIFPRDNSDWINWINKGKGLYLDKNKIQNLIAQQRKVLAEVSHLDLNSVAKIIKDFPNPKLSEENLRNIYGNFVETAEETADLLGGTKVVFESESTEKGTLGWYDPNDNSVHIVLPEHTNADDIKRTVFHEKLGHEGLVALLGSQDEVDKFGQFVFGSASKDIRNRIIEKANENDPGWKDHLRFSHAAQEVIADIAENGPRTADEFSLWRKIKHYLIRLLNKLGLKVRGLLNDHDLAYYILKTGEALKKWNQMSDPDKEAAARQYDIMRSRRGKPRKRNNESMAQYLQRLRDWEMWKIAEEQAAANNDPMPDADKINEKWHDQFNRDMDEWRRNNNIPEGESLGEFPKRRQNETPQEYAARVVDYETEADAWKNAPSLFDYLQRANEEYRQAYADWKMRYGIREAENVDLGLYEGDPDRLPHIVNPEDLEADNRAEADLAEAVGVDMSPEGARRHTKLSVIERRKNLESANAEDAIWIHNMVNSINMEAHRQGVEPKMLREALADIIEGTYFEEVLKDDEGNVIAINDISDQLPIKMTTGLRDILAAIKDWYDYFYHEIEDAGLRNDAGYVEEGYVNHVWSREKSNPEAWKKYVDNFQRTKSPNMRERLFKTYREGEDVGLVRKYTDIADILAHYSSSNNQAIANKKFLDDLSFIVVEELNGDGEVVSVLPLLNSQKPNIAVSDRYSMYQVPGVGDVYVLKDVQRTFANIFGTMRTTDVPEWLTKTGKIYDVASSTAKKIQLSFSAFHMGALTEVAMAQMRPDRAMRALAQYIILDSAKTGTIPAYAHPEDFKFAASHLVQLGATQDYSAADVNNVTEKIREMVRELANSEQVAKKGAGFAATPVAAALDYINKGMDKVLWNYLHDGLKIACFKMFAEQVDKRVEKEGLTPEKREELLDEAGQYVNDTFGGQWFELLNISPALIKWLRRGFLSPDWLLSTQRHFLANFGFGSLYSESGFLNYLRYNRDNIKRAFGTDIPRDENRRFRSKNAKQCYLLGVCGFFYIMMNAINAFFRAQDEEKEKEKADEIRRDNPDYRSGYELAYPDGMKWYDYTMYGNTIGQQTHLFLGRYNDGTEWYARWGKQFREFPELFMGRHGVEFPTPLMERMSGKANPIGRYLLYDLPLTVGMYGYKQPRETQEIAEKYGNTVALLAMTAKKFLPFSVPTQEDKEFKMFDLVMPSQKGFTRWKAVDYFKTYIQAGDMDGIQRTYNAAVMNGIDAEDCLKAAISTVKATQKKQLQDGIVDLQTAMEHFDAAKGASERKLMKRRIVEYLAEQNYKTFTRDEAMEQVNEFLNGTAEADNDINKYVELQTSGDVRDDYRLNMIRKQAKKYVDEVKTAEGERQERLADTYAPWMEIDHIIKTANSQIGKLKRQLGKGGDDAEIMKQIREIRSNAQKEVDKVKAP